MGLASAYGITRNHGGVINVYSELQKGTTFSIYIPASEKEAIDEQASVAVPIKGQESILVMDVGRH